MEPGRTPSSCIDAQLTRLADTATVFFSDGDDSLPNEDSLLLQLSATQDAPVNSEGYGLLIAY